MKIIEATKPQEPAVAALKQREQALKKQKATLRVQKAMKQLHKASAPKTSARSTPKAP